MALDNRLTFSLSDSNYVRYLKATDEKTFSDAFKNWYKKLHGKYPENYNGNIPRKSDLPF